ANIYITRGNPAHGWDEPTDVGCQVNSAAGEAGPSYFETPVGCAALLLEHERRRQRRLREPTARRRQLRTGGAGAQPEHAERRLPTERTEERARGRLRLKPHRDPRRAGHLVVHTGVGRRRLIDTDRSRDREHALR